MGAYILTAVPGRVLKPLVAIYLLVVGLVIVRKGLTGVGEAKVRTLPEKTEYCKLKGDHSEKAMLITVNVDYNICRPQDVFFAIKEEIN